MPPVKKIKYLLVFVHTFSGWVEACLLLIRADTVITFLVEEIILQFGLPTYIQRYWLSCLRFPLGNIHCLNHKPRHSISSVAHNPQAMASLRSSQKTHAPNQSCLAFCPSHCVLCNFTSHYTPYTSLALLNSCMIALSF